MDFEYSLGSELHLRPCPLDTDVESKLLIDAVCEEYGDLLDPKSPILFSILERLSAILASEEELPACDTLS